MIIVREVHYKDNVSRDQGNIIVYVYTTHLIVEVFGILEEEIEVDGMITHRPSPPDYYHITKMNGFSYEAIIALLNTLFDKYCHDKPFLTFEDTISTHWEGEHVYLTADSFEKYKPIPSSTDDAFPNCTKISLDSV